MDARKRSVRLADGRELIYYDEDPGAERDAKDTRPLEAAATASELRHDPLVDEWVVVASHRQDRTHLPPAQLCPLCPSTPTRPTEVPSSDYDVVVFENRFPSLTTASQGPAGPAGGLSERAPGVGRCEVVCFTSDHGGSLGGLPTSRLRTVSDVWADRTQELSRIPGVEQVFPFENRGEEIGVTLSHPHGQVYALPFVAPRTARTLEQARAHRGRTGRCLFCDVIAAEQASVRVVGGAPGWVAFVPEAARWPFEVHLYPTRHLPDLPALDEHERDGLVALLPRVLAGFDGLFGAPMPYMATWHQAPVYRDRDLAHLRLEVFSIRRAATRLKYLASTESGAGVFVNDVGPERAAELLRRAVG